jgi:Zn-dependent M28 family amino/carboxypeptidase
MKRIALLLLLLLPGACRDTSEFGLLKERVADLQQQALQDDTAWNLLESLTSEVGPRMGGSDGDAKAVAWARAAMQELGFDRVWLEHVEFPRWVRNHESAQLLSGQPVTLDITALGGSPGTSGALQAEVVRFEHLEALEAAGPDAVSGKIAYIGERMVRSMNGSGYGKTVRQRSRGPFVAARKGAIGLLIRSAGTDMDGVPHTGMISSSEPGDPVPSAALSHPAADRLEAAFDEGAPVTVELNLDCGWDGNAVSQNVIGEFDGSGDTGRYVIVGGHLDSWDLGTGAVDDGSGVAITMAAATLVARQPQRPLHGTRVVLFANEEQGVYGGKAYASMHANQLDRHVLGSESDLGSGRIFQFTTRVNEASEPAIDQLAQLLASLDIPRKRESLANGGADIGQMRKLGMPVIDLRHDATHYFDLHHTRNDVLENVDPSDIRFNVAAYVTLIEWAASNAQPFGPVAPSP